MVCIDFYLYFCVLLVLFDMSFYYKVLREDCIVKVFFLILELSKNKKDFIFLLF